MINFIIANWLTILVVAIVLAYIIYLIVRGKWTELRELAYALMLRVETLYEENQGQEKFNEVFALVYNQIPKWLQVFIKPDEIKSKLQAWYDVAMDFLDDGEINNKAK